MKSNVIGFNNVLVTCMDYNIFEIAATISFIALWRSVLHEQLWNVETDKVNVGLWFWCAFKGIELTCQMKDAIVQYSSASCWLGLVPCRRVMG